MPEFAISVETTADPLDSEQAEMLTNALTAIQGSPDTYLRQLYVRAMVDAPSKGTAVGIVVDAVEIALRSLEPSDNEVVEARVQTRRDFEEAGRWPVDPTREEQAARAERLRATTAAVRAAQTQADRDI